MTGTVRTLAALCAVTTLIACDTAAPSSAYVPAASGQDAATAAGGAPDASVPDAQTSASDAGLDPCAVAARGIEVNAIDLDGYPPYAVDGCQLVYVSSPESAQAGALVLRDLTSGAEKVLAPADHSPRRPSIAAPVITWEELDGTTRVVRVASGSDVTTLTGPFDHAGEPRAARDAVVFTGWLTADDNGDTDVFLYTLASHSLELVLGGPAQQRFSDVSMTHIAISDFSEDPSGAYDPLGIALADVVVVDRATGTLTRRQLPGKQAYPMLGADGHLVYLEWVGVRPMPKLEGYDVRAVSLSTLDAPGDLIASVTTDPPAIRPVALGGTIEWVQRSSGVSSLMRAPVDNSWLAETVPGLEGLDLYAPAASKSFTVLATTVIAPGALLDSVAR